MKYRQARILTLLLYGAAVVLFFIRALCAGQETALHIVTAAMLLLVVLGFTLNFRALRCPKCGRVMKATMSPQKGCPYCGEPLLAKDEEE